MALLSPKFLPTKTYPFIDLRHALEQLGPWQEGVWAAGDYKVSQRAAGANMSVDVAAGGAWVRGDDVARQGHYHLVNDGVVNATVAAADGTNPRIDQVIARVYDSSVVGSSDTPTIEVLTGTPSSGATLDNRTGAAALPNGAVRLADVLVPAGSTSVTTANIRDRRPWARGAYFPVVRTSNAGGTDDYSTSSGSFVAIDSTNLNPRIECSGAPVRVSLRGLWALNVASAMQLQLRVDGAVVDGGARYSHDMARGQTNIDWFSGLHATWDLTPAAGSHTFAPYWLTKDTAGILKLAARSAYPLQLVVEELVRQSAQNV